MHSILLVYHSGFNGNIVQNLSLTLSKNPIHMCNLKSGLWKVFSTGEAGCLGGLQNRSGAVIPIRYYGMHLMVYM